MDGEFELIVLFIPWHNDNVIVLIYTHLTI